MNAMDQLNRLLRPIWTLLRQTATKGVINSVDDSGAQQVLTVQTGDGEVLDKMERIEPMGLTSVPAAGDEVIVLIINGDRDHAIAVQVGSSAKRVKGLAEGEVAVWRDDANKVVFKANGDIEVHGEGKFKVTPSGDIELGSVGLKKLATEDFVNQVYKMHTHPTAPVGPVSVPTPIPMPTELTSKTKAE